MKPTLWKSDEFEGCNYVFTVSNIRDDKDSRIDISAIIDSGASVNIIDRHLWEYLKKNKINQFYFTFEKHEIVCIWESQFAGCFKAQVTVCGTDKSLQDVTFYVIEENG